MNAGYLSFSVITLLLGVLCFLGPGALQQLSRALESSVASLQSSMLQQKPARYIIGLLLMLVSFGMFRLAYMEPLFK